MSVDDPRLSYFLETATKVSAETQEELKEPLRHIEGIDLLFVDFIPDAGCVTPSSAAVLILNAHASYRAAISLALSGQLLPVFMALRGSIESVLYANAMVARPALQGVWLNRGRNEESRKLCRDEFTIGGMFRYLTEAHEKTFSDALNEAYQSTIDFGAHPNSHSLLQSIRVDELVDGKRSLNFAYIHSAYSFELRQSLVACAEIGTMVFLVALICSHQHPRLKELNQRALDLQAAGQNFIEDLGLNTDRPIQR